MSGNVDVNLTYRRLSIFVLAAGAVGALFGAYMRGTFDELGCGNRYPLLNAARACMGTQPPIREYEEFENDLSEWIDAEKQAGDVEVAAVYFRDLRGGPWFGINERETFIPASLFKVPVMIALLRAAQDDPMFLKQELGLSGPYAGINNVESPDQTMQPGKTYTADELLTKMIVYSDNASNDVLKAFLDASDVRGDAIKTIYGQLGMLAARDDHQLTVKSYSSLFRVLYNAQYLNVEMSQKALSLLTRSAYVDGLVAGVPAGVKVAHKFGIRDISGEQTKQFHDCGIVYHPKRPYLLCVMTRGNDMQKNIAIIAEISRRVYAEVDAQFAGETR